ncbi:unnamed protein product [Chondrus crispus]|uniref:Uncharacterized protein n=1 Tax=Chondrus crispus TaxID=2769 RepID=R7QQG9_CHOCR|nr:unnamed protein product [Chondrus crispus]CDF39630.1 unnamed protein product [Chondrus crispus]|eukprot:XP_005709924.1 unnamed protein product [Chondrus crispus]
MHSSTFGSAGNRKRGARTEFTVGEEEDTTHPEQRAK